MTLELASKYYRQIVITFMKADRFLKPCWPITLQRLEVFRVSGLTDPQLLISGDNYGGLRRTLDAFLTAYHCSSVEWEINWKTAYAPEFRLLPPKSGGTYANLQLLAVMRSLRYNGYFNSISFSGVDLSGLWEKLDTAGKMSVPYMNRSCLALSEVELGHVKFGSLLHKEIHALAFCSETVRQIDFTNCFTERNIRRNTLSPQDGPGFLFPILNLLELGLTKCNRLLLSGNLLRPADIHSLVEALMTQQVEVQALDISNCGLSDLALRDIFEVLFHQGTSLQTLNVSGNRGRIHASMVANLSQNILDLRKLNVAGVIMGDIPGPMFSHNTLSRFETLEELDLSQYKVRVMITDAPSTRANHRQVNDATLNALEKFLNKRPSPSSTQHNLEPTFRKLALNNCGVNGREAARLIRSMANHPTAHLHLNSNPLEDGIDDLCRAISHTPGPTGLHMDMVEFRHEANFVALIKALTANTNIAILSMAGTAATPSADGPCGTDVCQAFEDFFRGNTHVHHLDLSGYSGKLDEGQLAPGFARSLRGLAANTTLTHLRIRNQNLHNDVGTLGVVIRQNTTLRMIDCQENSWNLTSIQFLAKSLKLNQSIVRFPFPPGEYERVLRQVVADTRRQVGVGRAAVAMYQEQETVLRTALLRQVHELRETVMRNRELAEANGLSFAEDFEDDGDESGWPGLAPSSHNSSGGNKRYSQLPALKPQPSLRVEPPTFTQFKLLDIDLDSFLVDSPIEFPSDATTTICRSYEITNGGDDTENSPYHIPNDAGLLETPDAETGGCSPTDCDMPATPPPPPPESTPWMAQSEGESSSVDSGAKEQLFTPSFDMGPYFAGSGRDLMASRLKFRLGGLEAHEEE